MQQGRPRVWVEVDLDRIKQNYCQAMAGLGANAEAYAVVKSNAYGHGDAEVARALCECGVRHLAVASIDEAVRLREAGFCPPECEMLILGYTPPELADELCSHGLTQALLSEEYAEALAAHGKRVRAHFAIDTGMRRIGLDGSNALGCREVIGRYTERLDIRGIFTHLCTADSESDSDVEFTRAQISRFSRVARAVRGLGITNAHCLNSAGMLYHAIGAPEEVRRLVRPGIILYGLCPRVGGKLPAGIRPALSWRASVAMVKRVRRGESVGYGRAFTAPRDMTVATLPVGYADGYPRALSGRGCVLLCGRRAPIVGNICMNQMMVDASDIGPVSMGDEATLIGEDTGAEIGADELAGLAGTIGYEIIARIPRETERIYKRS